MCTECPLYVSAPRMAQTVSHAASQTAAKTGNVRRCHYQPVAGGVTHYLDITTSCATSLGIHVVSPSGHEHHLCNRASCLAKSITILTPELHETDTSGGSRFTPALPILSGLPYMLGGKTLRKKRGIATVTRHEPPAQPRVAKRLAGGSLAVLRPQSLRQSGRQQF